MMGDSMSIVRILFACACSGVLCLNGLSQLVEGDKVPGGQRPPAEESASAGKPAAKKPAAGEKGAKGEKRGAPQGGESHASSPVSLVSWRVVAELPAVAGQTKPGVAGVFAGALDTAHAVVAGGTFYEGNGPLEGGERTYSDRVLVLAQTPATAGAAPSYTWSTPDVSLPRPLAYGASVTLDEGVLMIGGSDGTVCVPDVRLVTWDAQAQRLVVADFPPLPKPLAYLGAGRVGTWVIVAGGTTTPDGRSGADVFGLDLSQRGEGGDVFVWQTLPALPVAVHFPIVVGEQGDDGRHLHVFGGRDLRPGQGDRVLAEGWRFDPAARSWTSSGAIAPGAETAPVSIMGGTAVALEEQRLLVLGGDDGQLARLMEENARRAGPIEERESYARLNAAILAAHPGHRRAQLLYDARVGQWREAGHFPEATPAVTPAFLWDGAIVLIGGEPAPGRRSARVWLGSLDAE
jgi:N-acetylneuraminic acid mutarotase